jgi:hypothetical protein
VVKEIAELHDRKNSDYAADDNPYSNFEFAAAVAKDFADPVDRVFATMMGIKLARLAQLRSGKDPLNEPVADTFRDLANYAVIWASYWDKPFVKPCPCLADLTEHISAWKAATSEADALDRATATTEALEKAIREQQFLEDHAYVGPE